MKLFCQKHGSGNHMMKRFAVAWHDDPMNRKSPNHDENFTQDMIQQYGTIVPKAKPNQRKKANTHVKRKLSHYNVFVQQFAKANPGLDSKSMMRQAALRWNKQKQ
jgi:hypothetical protein